MSSVVVLVDTEVPATEGVEDEVARPAVDGTALLSLAAVIHVEMVGWDNEGVGGGGGGAVACRPHDAAAEVARPPGDRC